MKHPTEFKSRSELLKYFDGIGGAGINIDEGVYSIRIVQEDKPQEVLTYKQIDNSIILISDVGIEPIQKEDSKTFDESKQEEPTKPEPVRQDPKKNKWRNTKKEGDSSDSMSN